MRLVVPLLAVAVSLVAAAPTPGASAVQFYRRKALLAHSDGTVNMEALLTSLNNTLKKYNAPRVLPTYNFHGLLGKRAGTGSVALTDQNAGGEDELYYGAGTVGTSSPQTFTFDFDTGSSDTTVPGPKCGTAQGCHGGPKYNQKGTDEHRKTTITYGSGSIQGEDYLDKICLSGLCAQNSNLISLTDASGFSSSDADGLMGFAFNGLAASGKPTFFSNLITQGQVTQPIFSFFLGRAKSHTQGASEMFLGGSNPAKYTGTPTTLPVTVQDYWQVAIDGATVNGASVLATAGQAIIDTGTTIVLAPTASAVSIFSNILGSFPLPLLSGSPTLTLFAYPCNTSATAIPKLTFAGQNFAINPFDFNLGVLTGGILGGLGTGTSLPGNAQFCLAGLAGMDINPPEELYVVGDVFLKNWYSIFNQGSSPSVSFAPAVGNNPGA